MRFKSFHASTFWAVLFFLFSFGKTIVLTPLMLTYWGKEVFALWAIVLSVRSVALFLSDGYLRFVANAYNLLYHKSLAEARALLGSAVVYCVVLSVIPAFVLLVAILFFPEFLHRLFNADRLTLETYRLAPALLCYLLACAAQNVQRLFFSVNEAQAKVVRNLQIEIAGLIIQVGVMSGMLYAGKGFAAVVYADSAVMVCIALFSIAYVCRYSYRMSLIRQVALRPGGVYFVRSLRFNAANLFEKLTSDGLVFLLAYFRVSPASVALFATFRTIANTPVLAQNLLLNTYTPELQRAFTLRDSGALNALFLWIRGRLAWFFLCGILCCLPLYAPVFSAWTRQKLVYDPKLMGLILMTVVVHLYGLTFLFVLKGLNVVDRLWVLMGSKAVVILAGFVFTAPVLYEKVFVLLWSEVGFSLVLLPFVFMRYFKENALSLRSSLLFRQMLPYIAAALFLYGYAFF